MAHRIRSGVYGTVWRTGSDPACRQHASARTGLEAVAKIFAEAGGQLMGPVVYGCQGAHEKAKYRRFVGEAQSANQAPVVMEPFQPVHGYLTCDKVKTRRGRASRSSSASAGISLPFSSRTLDTDPRSIPRTPEHR